MCATSPYFLHPTVQGITQYKVVHSPVQGTAIEVQTSAQWAQWGCALPSPVMFLRDSVLHCSDKLVPLETHSHARTWVYKDAYTAKVSWCLLTPPKSLTPLTLIGVCVCIHRWALKNQMEESSLLYFHLQMCPEWMQKNGPVSIFFVYIGSSFIGIAGVRSKSLFF